MIENLFGTKNNNVLSTLFSNNKYMFYLSGSRAWNMPKYNSDWNFFVQDSNDVHMYLRHLGFNSLPCPYLHKKMTNIGDGYTSYYELNDDKNPVVNIHIVRSAVIKNVIQLKLIEQYPNGFADTEHCYEIWRTAVEFYYLND